MQRGVALRLQNDEQGERDAPSEHKNGGATARMAQVSAKKRHQPGVSAGKRCCAEEAPRFGGFLYLIIIAVGLYGEMFIREKLVVSGDAAATF